MFALYGHSTAIGILGMIVVITDGTISLLVGISLYRQADFGPLCSTRLDRIALAAPCALNQTLWSPCLLLKPFGFAQLRIIFQTSQGIMWGLTLRKQQLIKKNIHPSLRAAVPFLQTVFRDGSIVLAILTRQLSYIFLLQSLTFSGSWYFSLSPIFYRDSA